MRTKYKTVFISRNEEDRTFDLTFAIEATKRLHMITDVQVYDRKRDVFLELSRNPATNLDHWHCTAKSILDYIQFDVDILVVSTGASVSVVEKVITVIHSEDNLQPCN